MRRVATEHSRNDGSKAQYYVVILDRLQDRSGGLKRAPESWIRGPLTFTPPPRLLRLEAMVPDLKKSVEVRPADVSWGGWVPSVIFRDEVWCLDIGGHLPRVVLPAETLPLNQELEPPLVPVTIQHLFYLLLWFSVDDNRWWRGSWLPSWYRIVRSSGQLDHIEHWVQLSQSMR